MRRRTNGKALRPGLWNRVRPAIFFKTAARKKGKQMAKAKTEKAKSYTIKAGTKGYAYEVVDEGGTVIGGFSTKEGAKVMIDGLNKEAKKTGK
jgi:hypothetical protein